MIGRYISLALRQETACDSVSLVSKLIGACGSVAQGGIQQQFKAAAPMVSSLLAGLLDDNKTVGKDGDCRRYILADEDAVGVWESDHVGCWPRTWTLR